MLGFLKIKEDQEVLESNCSINAIADVIREEINALFRDKKFNFTGELTNNLSYILRSKFLLMMFRPRIGPFVYLEVILKEDFKSGNKQIRIEVLKRLGNTFYLHFWFPVFLSIILFSWIGYHVIVSSVGVEMLFFPLLILIYGVIIYIIAYFTLENQFSRFKKLLKTNNISFAKVKPLS
ncbi:hypothetical protein [uncultured Dokdonia sp.]|uniref:hypothetical protein n=1 Tax=uncultured Dokdonia sp. TaxID=575653 RepID=UPI0026331FAE|nr:hypothetical protein [uncultured Dokdonia sp.]